jgi:hypothetical protein
VQLAQAGPSFSFRASAAAIIALLARRRASWFCCSPVAAIHSRVLLEIEGGVAP